MAIQNVIGDTGATWVSITVEVGWGEVINGVLVWFLMVVKKHQDA
jgi:hypothetical protein